MMDTHNYGHIHRATLGRMKQTPSVPLHLRLSSDLHARVVAIAERQRRPVASMLAIMVEDAARTIETVDAPGKDAAASAMGRKGAAARAEALTPERRAQIARKQHRSDGAK